MARRLAVDLERKIANLCVTLSDLSCPSTLRVGVNLTTDPETLATVHSQFPVTMDFTRIELPTPSLLAVPMDEAGYQALYRGYAEQVATVIITSLVGWECCNHQLFYEALLTEQLRRLGLRSPAYLSPYYETVVDAPPDLTAAESFWMSTTLSDTYKIPDPVYAVVDFLLQRGDASIVEMQQALMSTPDYEAWVRQFAPYGSEEDLAQGWVYFLQTQ